MDTMNSSATDALGLFYEHLEGSAEGEEFARALVSTYDAERESVDETIRKVSHHWRLERMTRVDRNILRLATVEPIEQCTEITNGNEALASQKATWAILALPCILRPHDCATGVL